MYFLRATCRSSSSSATLQAWYICYQWVWANTCYSWWVSSSFLEWTYLSFNLVEFTLNRDWNSDLKAGLRKLVGRIEEEQRLAQIQTLRNQSRLVLLVHESVFERKVDVGELDNTLITEIWQKWEVYQTSWSSFLQKYGKRDTDVISSNCDGGEEVIGFQDVPWPLMQRRSSGGIILLHKQVNSTLKACVLLHYSLRICRILSRYSLYHGII